MKLSELKVGDRLVTDDGFTCISANTVVTVQDCSAGLYVQCSSGMHLLAAQTEDDGETLVGLSREAVP